MPVSDDGVVVLELVILFSLDAVDGNGLLLRAIVCQHENASLQTVGLVVLGDDGREAHALAGRIGAAYTDLVGFDFPNPLGLVLDRARDKNLEIFNVVH